MGTSSRDYCWNTSTTVIFQVKIIKNALMVYHHDLFCVFDGTSCIDSGKNCNSFIGTVKNMSYFFGQRWFMQSQTVGTVKGSCSQIICTGAPNILTTDANYQKYHKDCYTTGCTSTKQCYNLISQTVCKLRKECTLANQCKNTINACSTYSNTNYSQCTNSKYYAFDKNLIQFVELNYVKINQQQQFLILNVKTLLILVLHLELVVQLFQHIHHIRLNLSVYLPQQRKMEQQDVFGMLQKINVEIEFAVIKMIQLMMMNVILSYQNVKQMDLVVGLELHVLNSPIHNSVLNPILDHDFGLMDNVMIMTDQKMLQKRHILNSQHSHHYVQPIETYVFLLHLVPAYHQRLLVQLELMDLVDGYLLANVKSSDNVQMLLLLQMMNVSLIDRHVLLMEQHILLKQLAIVTRHKQHVIKMELMVYAIGMSQLILAY